MVCRDTITINQCVRFYLLSAHMNVDVLKSATTYNKDFCFCPVHYFCLPVVFEAFTVSDVGPSQPKPHTRVQPEQREAAGASSQTFPRPPRRRPGLLHLQSCGDLSSFTCAALDSAEHRRKVASRAGSRAGSRTGSRLDHPERPHSLIGVFRETVL